MLRFFGTGKPADASLFVPWGKPVDASLFVPWGKPVDASLFWHGEASGCFAFLAREKGNRTLLLPSCSPLPSLGEGLGVRAGVGEGLSLS